MPKSTQGFALPSRGRMALECTVLALALCLFLGGCVRKSKPTADYGATVNAVGIKVSHDANRTVWKIPWAETFESDKSDLFRIVINDFKKHIETLNEKLDSSGARSNPTTNAVAARLSRSEELQGAIEKILFAAREDKTLEKRFQDALDPEYEQRYGKMRELSSIESYFRPQAFLVVVDMRIAGAAIVGGGGSFTFLWAFQPYVTVTIDNKTGKTADQSFEVDSEIFAVPSGELTCGIGGSASPHVGVGAIFGPMRNLADLAGVSVKVGVNGTLPVLGSATGRIGLLLKFPPLFYVAGALGPGAGAEGTCSGGIEVILSVDEFLKRFQGGSPQQVR